MDTSSGRVASKYPGPSHLITPFCGYVCVVVVCWCVGVCVGACMGVNAQDFVRTSHTNSVVSGEDALPCTSCGALQCCCTESSDDEDHEDDNADHADSNAHAGDATAPSPQPDYVNTTAEPLKRASPYVNVRFITVCQGCVFYVAHCSTHCVIFCCSKTV